MRNVGQQCGVLVADGRPVIAVHAGLVEPVPHDAPLVGIHLFPLHRGVDAQLHPRQVEVPLGGILLRFGLRDAVIAVLSKQDFFTACGQLEIVDAGEHFFLFLRFEVEEIQRGRFSAVGQVVHALGRGGKGAVISAVLVNGRDPRLEAFGIDANVYRFAFAFIF